MTNPIERHLDDFDMYSGQLRRRIETILTDAWTAVETVKAELWATTDEKNVLLDQCGHLRDERTEAERQRDANRKSLNAVADLLHVVHEDDKIIARVQELQDKLHDLRLGTEDLQLVCLALAELELRRPGWNYAIDLLAKKLNPNAPELVKAFKETSKDLIEREMVTMNLAPKDPP